MSFLFLMDGRGDLPCAKNDYFSPELFEKSHLVMPRRLALRVFPLKMVELIFYNKTCCDDTSQHVLFIGVYGLQTLGSQ